MFGNPFRKNVSAIEMPREKCRWCLKRIGYPNHAPVPVCNACFSEAYNDNAKWSRLCTEFEREMRAYVRKLQARPDMVDVCQVSMEANSFLVEIGKLVDAAEKRGDTAEFKELSELMRQVMDHHATFRREAPGLVRELEKEEA